MALVLADRVRETTTTAGTGTITLLGAVPSCQSFAVIGNGNTTYYTIVAYTGTEYEVGIGTYTASGTLLSRDTVLASSNGGSLVNFSAGTKDVFCDYPADKAVTTDTLAYPPAIGGTTPAAGTFTTLTATGTSFFGGVIGSEVARVSSGTNTGKFTNFSSDSVSNAQTVGAAGGANFVLFSSGTNSIKLRTNGAAGSDQMFVAHTALAVNYLQATGATTGNGPTFSAQGSDTNIDLNATSKGTGVVNLNTGAGTQVRIIDSGGTAVNRIHLQGQATGFLPVIASRGSDTNLGMSYSTQGTGGHDFYTAGTSFTQQFKVAHTASAVNYVQITGAATAGDASISAQGSDSNIWLRLDGKGSRGVAIGYFTRIGRSFANYFEATGNNAGSSPILSVGGSDTNIDINLTTKGTGGHYFNTGNGTQARISDTVSAVNYIQLTGGAAGATPAISIQGTGTNVNVSVSSKGTGAVRFFTNNTSQEQLQVAHTASAVNYVQVTGAATGSSAQISSQGSDSNIGLQLRSKGTGAINLMTAGGTNQVVISNTASSVNYATITGSATGFGVAFGANGSDTNIPLVLQPKGTGALQAQLTDSTATGGNARGSYAIDWQTERGSASQVASGSYATIGGGRRNTSSAGGAVVGGGWTNNASGTESVIAGGSSSISSGQWSFIGGGVSHTAAGFYNVIGGGFTNSGNSGSVITTQGTTSVTSGSASITLSGSNANIRVGQLVGGTGIPFPVYVSAVSGTSLTISSAATGTGTPTLSFYTVFSAVVGGGNNTATGSYSFIGGGGDAGSSGDRNTTSGDWSSVVGGKNNQATGQFSFIGNGGATFGTGYGNRASSVNSFVGNGYSNNASGYQATVVNGNSSTASGGQSFIGGGGGHTANGQYSAIVGGANGTTRGIEGNQVFPACLVPISSTNGTSQAALLILGRQTTDATATVLTSNTSAAGTTNQVILPNNSAYFFTGEVVAGVTGGGNTKGWTIEGVIKRGANAASTALVGTPTVTSTYADAGASTWVIAVTADTTNGGLAVTFTGQASTTIRTVCQVRTTEMTY